ncbi:MAG: bifunctional hydroxymethylpyrimidine kinase/phosphomethylpyrimidine kinase [Gemmatimonadaceae bacterium]|jgi:hydroxymethylpyrimidine/phosphomethylpyrimidine kinase|nr:bifunctional hydroxymethylpyrimidine kinase/phosphomethylpyrimidine kinase [Gemmatimonadaceae bacterium]
MIPNVLAIAGSDPSGGAGIQADLKAFTAMRVYGAAAITALTAQNTRAVTGVYDVPAHVVAEQLDTLFADVRIDAVKIGMVATAALARTIAERLDAHGVTRVVLDPVMVAKSGDALLAPEAVAAVREWLLPRALVLTPNLPEATALADRPTHATRDDMPALGAALRARGSAWVLVKGGHLDDAQSSDVLVGPADVQWFDAPRIATSHTHGTGCSLSSAIAARLGHGDDVPTAVDTAKRWLTGAIAEADTLAVGSGHGPIHHFHALWRHDA